MPGRLCCCLCLRVGLANLCVFIFLGLPQKWELLEPQVNILYSQDQNTWHDVAVWPVLKDKCSEMEAGKSPALRSLCVLLSATSRSSIWSWSVPWFLRGSRLILSMQPWMQRYEEQLKEGSQELRNTGINKQWAEWGSFYDLKSGSFSSFWEVWTLWIVPFYFLFALFCLC